MSNYTYLLPARWDFKEGKKEEEKGRELVSKLQSLLSNFKSEYVKNKVSSLLEKLKEIKAVQQSLIWGLEQPNVRRHKDYASQIVSLAKKVNVIYANTYFGYLLSSPTNPENLNKDNSFSTKTNMSSLLYLKYWLLAYECKDEAENQTKQKFANRFTGGLKAKAEEIKDVLDKLYILQRDALLDYIAFLSNHPSPALLHKDAKVGQPFFSESFRKSAEAYFRSLPEKMSIRLESSEQAAMPAPETLPAPPPNNNWNDEDLANENENEGPDTMNTSGMTEMGNENNNNEGSSKPPVTVLFSTGKFSTDEIQKLLKVPGKGNNVEKLSKVRELNRTRKTLVFSEADIRDALKEIGNMLKKKKFDLAEYQKDLTLGSAEEAAKARKKLRVIAYLLWQIRSKRLDEKYVKYLDEEDKESSRLLTHIILGGTLGAVAISVLVAVPITGVVVATAGALAFMMTPYTLASAIALGVRKIGFKRENKREATEEVIKRVRVSSYSGSVEDLLNAILKLLSDDAKVSADERVYNKSMLPARILSASGGKRKTRKGRKV